MNISIGIIATWPRKLTGSRQRSRFDSTYSQTVDQLERELTHQRAHSAVVQLALRADDLRLDGQIRANSQPAHPGVILSFTGAHGHVTMPCDRYTHWHDNLRAITLSLEALRAVDRYGVTTSGEQYKGWKQLPGGIEVGPATMTVEEAARAVIKLAGCPPERWQPMIVAVDAFRTCYSNAVKRWHPDKNNGNTLPDWHLLQQAADVLKKHHGIS